MSQNETQLVTRELEALLLDLRSQVVCQSPLYVGGAVVSTLVIMTVSLSYERVTDTCCQFPRLPILRTM